MKNTIKNALIYLYLEANLKSRVKNINYSFLTPNNYYFFKICIYERYEQKICAKEENKEKVP